MTRKAKKKFDALAFKRRAQAKLSKAVQGMTPAQQREYIAHRAETGNMGAWVKRVKRATLERRSRSGAA